MSDPKDELADRFEEHSTDDTSETDQPSSQDDTDETDTMDNPSTTRREKQQVAMYLPGDVAAEWNNLYDRLDARSKLNNQGGIEKNADFAEAVVELAINHEDELAERIEVGSLPTESE